MQKLTKDITVEELFDVEETQPLQLEVQTPVNEHDTFFQALNDGIQLYWAIKKLLHKNKNQILRFYANQLHNKNIYELEDIFLNGLILQEFTYDEKKTAYKLNTNKKIKGLEKYHKKELFFSNDDKNTHSIRLYADEILPKFQLKLNDKLKIFTSIVAQALTTYIEETKNDNFYPYTEKNIKINTMLNVIAYKMKLPNPEFQIIPNIHNYKTHKYAITDYILNYNILPNLKTIQQIQPNVKNVQKKTQEIYQEYQTLWAQNLENITHEYL